MSNIEPIIDKATDVINPTINPIDSLNSSSLSSIKSPFKYNVSLFNMTDKNTYVIALNNSANAMVFSFFVLFLFVFYIICMYLASFIFIPIDTITSESQMFNSLIFNPDSATAIFSDFIKSKLENFSNISDSPDFLGLPIHKITTTLKYATDHVNYWFHRGLLYFYINKGTISSVRRE